MSVTEDHLRKVLAKILDDRLTATEEKLLSSFDSIIDNKLKPVAKQIEVLKVENLNLKQRVTVLENQMRRSNVEIVGFPVDPKVKLPDVVRKVAQLASVEMKSSDITAVYRIGKVKKFSNHDIQDIIVELADAASADRLLSAVANLRKDGKQLSASDISPKAPGIPISVFRQVSNETKKLR